jgi:pantetheine-phosphate adenylyltransferase
MPVTVVYPGTFDPVTYGHLDLIERCLKYFSNVIVAVASNEAKEPLFTLDERVELMRKATEKLDGVVVEGFEGLLADYVKKRKACVVIRGLRATSDFEYELQMALANRQLLDSLETLFLMPSQEYIFLSSRIVRAVAGLGGDVSTWVPPTVYEAVMEKYRQLGKYIGKS